MGRVAGLTAEETRERVLDAAAAVFAEQGYEGARVAAIAKQAGLSVGAIYNHWPSKADLLAAVVERTTSDELMQLFTSGATSDGVLDIIATMGRVLDERPPVAPLLAEVALAARRDPESAEVLRREVAAHEAVLVDLFRFGQSAGDVDHGVSPEVGARYCLMLGLGSLLVRAIGLPSTPHDDWASLIDRLVDGFRTT